MYYGSARLGKLVRLNPITIHATGPFKADKEFSLSKRIISLDEKKKAKEM